jgi:hypothetical protein
MPDPSDPLDSLLDELGRRTPSLPAPLAPEVWRRVSLAQDEARDSWWQRLHAVFARPSFAAAFVVACVFLGLFLAEVRRTQRQAEYNHELMQSYLRLVDPLLKAADRATFAQTGGKS